MKDASGGQMLPNCPLKTNWNLTQWISASQTLATHLLQVNGEAAHFAARRLFGQTYIIGGSKTVHIIFRSPKDVDLYTGPQYACARTICALFLETLASLTSAQKALLLDFLCETRLTAIMELLDPQRMRVEDLSALPEPRLVFIAWTRCDLGETGASLCCLPPHVAIDMAEAMGEGTESVRPHFGLLIPTPALFNATYLI